MRWLPRPPSWKSSSAAASPFAESAFLSSSKGAPLLYYCRRSEALPVLQNRPLWIIYRLIPRAHDPPTIGYIYIYSRRWAACRASDNLTPEQLSWEQKTGVCFRRFSLLHEGGGQSQQPTEHPPHLVHYSTVHNHGKCTARLLFKFTAAFLVCGS